MFPRFARLPLGQGDTAKFRQSLEERGDEFAKIAEESKGVGALHHRFGGLLDRVGLYTPYDLAPEVWSRVARRSTADIPRR